MIRLGKIVAVGLNYPDHIREAGLQRPAEPLIFTKFTTSGSATETRSRSTSR